MSSPRHRPFPNAIKEDILAAQAVVLARDRAAAEERPALARDFDPEVVVNREHLLCPRCGDTYLHHRDVVVYSRVAEDGPGVAVTVGLGVSSTTRFAAANKIPGRRGAVEIVFSCENCGGEARLTLMQHKGETLVEWIDLGIAKEELPPCNARGEDRHVHP